MKTMGGAFSTLVTMLLGMAFAVPVYSQEAVKNTATAAVESKETVATTSAVKKMLDLKTRTEVTKKLDRTEDTATGKTYHYLYRVQARPTAMDTPRYLLAPSFSVSYAKKNFQANDTMTLISDNEETGTDSPIWVYEVAYVGAGARTLEFTTAGEVEVANYDAVSGEVVPATIAPSVVIATPPNVPKRACAVASIPILIATVSGVSYRFPGAFPVRLAVPVLTVSAVVTVV